MIRIFAVLAVIALGGCGADGEPIKPSLNAGVSIGSGGVQTSAGVGVSKGPVSINLGLF